MAKKVIRLIDVDTDLVKHKVCWVKNRADIRSGFSGKYCRDSRQYPSGCHSDRVEEDHCF